MKNDQNRINMWAPWRIEYILKNEKPSNCVLCDADASHDKDRLVLKRGKYSYMIMNFYPYNNGHIMICPYLHTSKLTALTPETKNEINQLIDDAINALEEVMCPDGYNIGMNIGECAGAGIADHLHWHIVPRWNGDTNFMPVLNNNRVIVEGLQETWGKLKNALN